MMLYLGTLDLSVYLVILNGKIDNINFLLRNFVSQRDILQKKIEVGNYIIMVLYK